VVFFGDERARMDQRASAKVSVDLKGYAGGYSSGEFEKGISKCSYS